jgi:hypothetical protein
MGCLSEKCDTCGEELCYPEIVAGDDICESCYLEHGIFDEDEVIQ